MLQETRRFETTEKGKKRWHPFRLHKVYSNRQDAEWKRDKLSSEYYVRIIKVKEGYALYKGKGW